MLHYAKFEFINFRSEYFKPNAKHSRTLCLLFVLFRFIQVKNFFDHDDYFNKV